MAGEPDGPVGAGGVRVGDADRDRAAKLLQNHFAQGRLDGDEFGQRLESVYTARTAGDLQALTADLPERDLADLAPPRPVPARAPSAGARPQGRSVLKDPALVIPWSLWAGVNALCFVIWLILFLTGDGTGYPWFLWVAVPWGFVMVFITVALVAVQRGGDEPPAE
ncbi:DUF1707 domain-containing protein [Nocardiopsis coralliicola]